MKTLILNGSPRLRGDTAQLIDIITKQLDGETRVVRAYAPGIAPCMDCRHCWNEPVCAIDDGMQDVYRYIQECDNILIASPVYFSELTGRLLDLASRLQLFYCARTFLKTELVTRPKKGGVVLVGGGDGGMERADATARVLLRHMNCQEIYPLIFSHNTDKQPAVNDADAVEGLKRLTAFFNQK